MTEHHIDNWSMRVLNYIYDHDNCRVSDLFSYLNVKNITDAPEIVATIIFFISKGYVALYAKDIGIVFSHVFQQYTELQMRSGNGFIRPDMNLIILPEGKYVVEESKRQKYRFNIPLIISIASILVSIAVPVFQSIFDSPISVRIIECLPK